MNGVVKCKTQADKPFIKSFQLRTFISCSNDFCLIRSLNCLIPGRNEYLRIRFKTVGPWNGSESEFSIQIIFRAIPGSFLFWNKTIFVLGRNFKAVGFLSKISTTARLGKIFPRSQDYQRTRKCRRHSVWGCARESATWWKLATITQICSTDLSGDEWQRLSSCCGDRRTRQGVHANDRSCLFILLTYPGSERVKNSLQRLKMLRWCVVTAAKSLFMRDTRLCVWKSSRW